jgi:hypothetical protein
LTGASPASDANVTLYILGNTGNSSTVTSTSAQLSTRAAFVDLAKRDAVSETLTIQSASDTTYAFLVALPLGKYYLHGTISGRGGTSANSNIFWVVEGSDTACLSAGGAVISASASAGASSTLRSGTITASASSSNTAAAGNAGSTDAKTGVSGGAIAGIAIGAIAGLAAVGLALFYFCYRRRPKRMEIGQPEMVTRGETAFGSQFAAGAAMMARTKETRPRPRSGDPTRGGHMELTSMGDSSDSHEKDEGPFVGSYGSEATTPTFLANFGQSLSPQSPSSRQNPFATNPNTPMHDDMAVFTDEFGAAAAAASTPKGQKRSSQPITSPNMTPERVRSNSQPSSGPSGKVAATIKRVPSARRKPVPSLGAELRSQLKNESGQKETEERIPIPKQTARGSFQLMPDPPRPPQ